MRVGVGLAFGALAFIVCADRAGSASAATASPTVHEWMAGTVGPQGMALADVVLKAINDAGKPDASGLTSDDWIQIAAAAQKLKDSSAVMATASVLKVAPDGVKIQDDGAPGSSSSAEVQAFLDKDPVGFKSLAKGLGETGDAFIVAAKARDAAKLLDASNALDGACTSCHSRFWYPQQAAGPAQ